MNSFQNKLDSCFHRNDNPRGILTQWVQTEKVISGQILTFRTAPYLMGTKPSSWTIFCPAGPFTKSRNAFTGPVGSPPVNIKSSRDMG